MRAHQILTSIPFNLASATLSAVAKSSSAIEGISASLYLKSVRKLMDCNQKGHFGHADLYLLSAGFSLFPLEVLAVQLLMISTSFGLRWMGTPNAFAIPGCKQFSHCISIMKSREMIRSYPQKSGRREWAQHPLMWKRGQTYQWTERLRQQWYQHRLR